MSGELSVATQEALDSLHHGIERCRKCRLHEERTHAVPGEGPVGARWMFVGEAPGEQEDKRARPFCGRAGRYLDKLLEGIGLVRGKIYITSSVKCRPPGNRDPKRDELKTCREAWLDRQIELIDPEVIVILGKTPLDQLFGDKGVLRDLHGTVRERGGRRYLITYHPAAGMRFPQADEAMREDFEVLRRIGKK